MAEATGGEFRHGFYSGFATGTTEARIGKWAGNSRERGVAAAAVVGGTASVLGGGKFANGAVSGAFSYLFNYLSHKRKFDVLIYNAEANREQRLDAQRLAERHGAYPVGASDAEEALDGVEKAVEKLGRPLSSIAIYDHARRGFSGISSEHLAGTHPFWAVLGRYILPSGSIYILGCNVAEGVAGERFINEVAATSERKTFGTPHYLATVGVGRGQTAFAQAESVEKARGNQFISGFPWVESK